MRRTETNPCLITVRVPEATLRRLKALSEINADIRSHWYDLRVPRSGNLSATIRAVLNAGLTSLEPGPPQKAR